MPANLTPQYKEAEARLKEASTPEEKLACLEEMLRLIPKHKGTEKLQADLKKRIAKARKGESKKTSRRHPGEYVDREGPRQTVLIGGPNAGKSSLLAALTSAHVEVAPYPYTTQHYQPGMMPFEDVKLQLIDSPALSRDFARPWMSSQLRACDLLVWVVNLANDDILTTVEETLEVLDEWHLELVPRGTHEPSSDDDSGARLRRPTLLVATHADDDAAAIREELLDDVLGEPWPKVHVAIPSGEGVEEVRRHIFDALDLVRVYTKLPGKPADRESPFLFAAGATVLDLAAAVHRDVAASLTFARIWGGDAYDGQHVQRDHVLADGDVVELHH